MSGRPRWWSVRPKFLIGLTAFAISGVACSGGMRRAEVTHASPAPGSVEQARRRFDEHGVRGAVVVLLPGKASDSASPPRRVVIESGDDASVRMLPASTFKIPNLLIGLETGAVAPDGSFPWDGKPRAMKDWERDLPLAEAFRVSCVPCFQELARRVGSERMQKWVRRLGYGNGETGQQVDRFWLEGPLAISVDEEADFVRRAFLEDVPFRRENVRFLKAAMMLEETPEYRLFGKSGWANRVDPNVGWFVGWLETRGGLAFFATRVLVPGDQPKIMAGVRKQLTLEVLRDLALVPKS